MSKEISRLDKHIGYWINLLGKQVEKSFESKLAKFKVTLSQWVVLRTLYDNKNSSLNEIASYVDLDDSSLSRMIERLVQKEYVIRETDPKNRRAVKLRLTAKSMELVPKLTAEADKNDDEFFNVLTEQQQKEFLATIQFLVEKNNLKVKPLLNSTET